MIINPKQHLRSVAIAAAGLFCVTLIAWNHEPVYQSGDTTYYQDTVPSQRPKSSGLRDLDVELEKLDRAIERLEHLKTRDWDHISERVHEQLNKINIEEMTKQAELAMKAVDLNKINIEAQKALKAIDVEVVQKQVNEAMAAVKIDTDAIQKAMNEVKIDTDVIQKAMNEVKIDTDVFQKAMNEVKVELDRELAEIKDLNTEEINEAIEIQEAIIKDLNTKEIHEAMDAVKAELKKAKEELKAENKDFKKELDNAKTDIQEAKKKIRGYQDMIYSMEKEGLVDTKNDYKIVYRDGSIFINDKKQTEAVSAKYRKYLKNNITIKKENGRFNIDSNQSKVD